MDNFNLHKYYTNSYIKEAMGDDDSIKDKIKLEEDETEAYNKLIWDTHHTENWGVEHDCRYDDCDGKISRKVLSHYENKYAFLECSLCGRHQKWLSYSK